MVLAKKLKELQQLAEELNKSIDSLKHPSTALTMSADYLRTKLNAMRAEIPLASELDELDDILQATVDEGIQFRQSLQRTKDLFTLFLTRVRVLRNKGLIS